MTHLPQVAVLAGSHTGEHEISVKSAQRVFDQIDRARFEPWLVILEDDTWKVKVSNQTSCLLDPYLWEFEWEGREIVFDVAFVMMHGVPGESGQVQGLLDLVGIPYTSPSLLVSALTMNKFLTKTLVSQLGIAVAPCKLYRALESKISIDEAVDLLGLPLFVKPNHGGSSLATFKVKSKSEMVDALEAGFEVDDEVLAEAFLPGRELTMGIYQHLEEIVVLPPTEIIPHNEFFDYAAKYAGQSDEITPANLDARVLEEMESISRNIYKHLNIHGLVRIDFILHPSGQLYFMEVNTVPGFSEASIVPQQIRASGRTESQVISALIDEALRPLI